jgi:hypothetical protein
MAVDEVSPVMLLTYDRNPINAVRLGVRVIALAV